MHELEKIYRKDRDKLVRKLNKILKNTEEAEDVLQNAFIRAFKIFHKYDDKRSSVTTWFNMIMMTELWEQMRKNKKIPFASDVTTCKIESPDNISITGVLQMDLEKVENEQHRNVLLAYYVYGFSYQEIAFMYDLTQFNTRKIIQRYREKEKDDLL